MEYSIYLTREKKRTSDINLRAYNNRKGARGGNQGDSNERSKTCSFHDEKTVKYRYSWFIGDRKKKKKDSNNRLFVFESMLGTGGVGRDRSSNV